MAGQGFPSFVSAFFMRCCESPRHLLLERDAHSNGAQAIALENKTVDTGPILTAFGGSMARKAAERNTHYG